MTIRHTIARIAGRCHFLRLGLRRRIVRWLAPADQLVAQPFTARHFAGTYRGNLANAQDWHVYFFSGYELKELALMTDLVALMDNAVVLDIGGNQGGHTLTLARVARQVHSVEPYPPLAAKIADLVKLNNLENVTIHQVGLGAEAGVFDYFLDTQASNQGTGSFLPDHNTGGVAAQLQIVRGDDYFAGKIEQLDFIKIDIEGYEAPALAGLRSILATHQPLIMMEVTESSAKLFAGYGGMEAVFPFDFDLWEIANPHYPLGVFQRGKYRLLKDNEVSAKRASFNVLVVPKGRGEMVGKLVNG